MIFLGTLAGLLEHRHRLEAYCLRCDRWRTLPLTEIVGHAGHDAGDDGRDHRVFVARTCRKETRRGATCLARMSAAAHRLLVRIRRAVQGGYGGKCVQQAWYACA